MKSVEDVRAQLQRLADNPAEAVRSAADLAELVADLEPPALGVMARPHFERASAWSFPCIFEHVTDGKTPVSKRVIFSTGDVWIRGVTAVAYPSIVLPTIGDLGNALIAVEPFAEMLGPEWRGLFELEYQIDGQSGFITDGLGAEQGDGRLLTGDGHWMMPLDWVLQREQTLQVTPNARLAVQGLDVNAALDHLGLISELRYLVVTFWGEPVSGAR